MAFVDQTTDQIVRRAEFLRILSWRRFGPIRPIAKMANGKVGLVLCTVESTLEYRKLVMMGTVAQIMVLPVRIA